MKVLVCGGRDFSDRMLLFNRMDMLHREFGPFTEIIEGDATGADKLAGQWAVARGVPNRKFPASWKHHGLAAGPIRNKVMLQYGPDLVVSFPGGKGTAHMVGIAETAGVPVKRIS